MFIMYLFSVFSIVLTVFQWNFCLGQVPAIPCNADYKPEDCDLPALPLSSLNTVEDFERCAPALLAKPNRNFYWSASGRQDTYFENKQAFKRIHITNRVLRDVSNNYLSTTVLGQKISFPVGVDPTAAHILAHPTAENGTARGAAAMDTVMILSSFATVTLEDVALNFGKKAGHLWMQIFLFEDKSQTLNIVRRAEMAGYKAIVLSVDCPINAKTRCNGKATLFKQPLPNFYHSREAHADKAATFEDLEWLVSMTKLPIVVKGILTGEDAVRAAKAGAAAILVSNQGGRQLDSAPASIDALPEVVSALRKYSPKTEIYMDGGVRTGNDVFKALLRGARAVFVGRPVIWGLAAGGDQGVKKVLEIMKNEFHETMIVAGYANPEQIMEASELGNPAPSNSTASPQ